MVTTSITIKHRLRSLLNRQTLVTNRIPIYACLVVGIVLFSYYGLSDGHDEMKSEISISKEKTMEEYKEGWITDYPQIKNMIILPCHSVYAPELNKKVADPGNSDRFSKVLDGDNWVMADFQKESEDQVSFLKHLEMSLLELHENIGDSALVVSGGFTKRDIEKSESGSYLEVAQSVGFMKNPYFRIGTNILVEEYARDSYENVLYSICAFYNKFGKFPEKITVVGFGFKKERFIESHLQTLGYADRSKYVSVGPFYPDPEDGDVGYEARKDAFWKDLVVSEKKNALDLFKLNPFGSKGSKLFEKKKSRDPWAKHDDVYKIYNKNAILKELVRIDDLELTEAKKVYDTKVKVNFPLYNNLN